MRTYTKEEKLKAMRMMSNIMPDELENVTDPFQLSEIQNTMSKTEPYETSVANPGTYVEEFDIAGQIYHRLSSIYDKTDQYVIVRVTPIDWPARIEAVEKSEQLIYNYN